MAGAILVGPTIMMGATFPVLADHLAALRGRRIAPEWLYTLNLLGAVVGVAAAGFVLMPVVGVWGTILLAAGLNIGVGAAVLRLPVLPEATIEKAGTEAARPGWLLVLAAFVSGATSLATQVAWTRVLVLVVGSTVYAFSIVLLVYLTALGAGSAWASRFGRRWTGVRAHLAIVHALMALALLVAVSMVNRLPYWYLHVYQAWKPETFAAILGLSIAIVLAALLWPVLLAGTVLPLVLVGALEGRTESAGPVVGRLYAVNTAGAILGAVLTGFCLIPLVGSESTLLGVAAVAAAMGCVFSLAGRQPSWLRVLAFSAAAGVALGVSARPDWDFLELHVGVFEPSRINVQNPTMLKNPGEQAVYAREGPTASVLVVQEASGERNLIINSRGNASDSPTDMTTQVLLAQVPLLVAPRTDDVFVVGWGSGVTVGSALASPVQHVTAAEIEPAVVEASRLFLHVNHDPLRDPRLRLYEDDARHILLASRDSYDVIISEPPHPWAMGVANIFTQDFYRLVDRRLRDDGVFAQWLQKYQISFETFRSILAALQSVFPEVMAFDLGGSLDTVLIASRKPLRLDVAELERRWNGAELGRVGVHTAEDILARFLVAPEAVRGLVAGARVNTDNNMYVEFNGPRDMVLAVSAETSSALDRRASPVEDVLADPRALIGSRERLERPIAALRRLQKPTERYERLLATLG
ncbi:MAG: hypothetical protein E6J75_11465 [Deltaproteobacteria bacterium]|nr:MAG: hypothetical protein E6J75_11465 [Deltaproteobacteria bacterium]